MSDPLEGVERPPSVPTRTPRPARTRKPPTITRREACPECGEHVTIPSDHLPSCTHSVAVVGVYLPIVNAVLDATGSTPVKFMLHADGTVTWRPLYGQEQ